MQLIRCLLSKSQSTNQSLIKSDWFLKLHYYFGYTQLELHIIVLKAILARCSNRRYRNDSSTEHGLTNSSFNATNMKNNLEHIKYGCATSLPYPCKILPPLLGFADADVVHSPTGCRIHIPIQEKTSLISHCHPKRHVKVLINRSSLDNWGAHLSHSQVAIYARVRVYGLRFRGWVIFRWSSVSSH